MFNYNMGNRDSIVLCLKLTLNAGERGGGGEKELIPKPDVVTPSVSLRSSSFWLPFFPSSCSLIYFQASPHNKVTTSSKFRSSEFHSAKAAPFLVVLDSANFRLRDLLLILSPPSPNSSL
ncbi:hypothetical protein FRC02_003138 [Tulasnella sp. 418]|nr:hypothetical protein FRC02_003138 [Tulasnella sp. 418]